MDTRSPTILPSHERVAVDCQNCRGRHFEVHVRIVRPDARIEEIVCANCGTGFATEYGLIRGKLSAPLPNGPEAPEKRSGGVRINVPSYVFRKVHNA